MAGRRIGKGHTTGTVITTPSPYGSHASMIVEEHDVELQAGEVLLEDDKGRYITLENRLDTGIVDHNRHERRV
jgi:hypothetical protein